MMPTKTFKRKADNENLDKFAVGDWVIIDDLYSGPIISAEPDPDFPDTQAIMIRISADKGRGYWTGENQHNSGWFRVDLHDIKWVGTSQRDDDYRHATPEEMAGQEHLMMTQLNQPCDRLSSAVPRIIVKGAVYKQAQLQELLQQYESASGQIINILTNAHQAALGKDFGKANATLKKLDGVMDPKALRELMELNDTMAGVAGLEGSN